MYFDYRVYGFSHMRTFCFVFFAFFLSHQVEAGVSSVLPRLL